MVPLPLPSSSYTRYLPPFLWSLESDPGQFLAQFLCIFEGILTGRDDAGPLLTVRNGQYREDLPFETMIDRLPDLFNPWRVPVRFLPFLAGSLGLTLNPDWNEYQQRRIIESASALFQQRWLKRGLYTYLGIYAASSVPARVTIDDGEAILHGPLMPDGSLPLNPTGFARPGSGPTHIGAALSHPTALVVAGTGDTRHYIVADAGPQDLGTPSLPVERGALWAVSLNGKFLTWKPAPSSPNTLVPAPLNDGEPAPALLNPIAIATESDGVYLVLDAAAGQANSAVIYRYRTLTGAIATAIDAGGTTPTPIVITTTANHGLATGNVVTISGVSGLPAANGTFTITVVDVTHFSLNGTTTAGSGTGGTWTLSTLVRDPQAVIAANILQAGFPVDMVRDPASGNLLVLDQGTMAHGDTSPGATAPRVLSVSVPAAAASSMKPLALGTAAIYPTALVLGPTPGTLLIADAGQQQIPADTPVPYSATLLASLAGDVLSMPITGATPAVSLLKTASGKNTGLVNPVALALPGDGSLLILDDGLKRSRVVQINGTTVIPNTGVLVSPARVLRVNPASPGLPTPLSLTATLVKPSRILVDGSTTVAGPPSATVPNIVVLEKGSFLTPITGPTQNTDWRCMAHCFGVTVDFSRQDFGNLDINGILDAQRLILKGLADVLDTEKPAHSNWSFQFQFDPGQSR